MFMATIVLVMHLYFNKATEGEDDAARKAEVVAACKMLEEAKSQSAMASEFLESLMDVLRKHKVRLHNQEENGVVVTDEAKELRFHLHLHKLQDTSMMVNGGGHSPQLHPEQQQPLHNASKSIQQDISQHYLSDLTPYGRSVLRWDPMWTCQVGTVYFLTWIRSSKEQRTFVQALMGKSVEASTQHWRTLPMS